MTPRSHGSYGHDEELGEEFSVPEENKAKSPKKSSKTKFEKMKEKAIEIARQNLE
jgi:hypothetical protein